MPLLSPRLLSKLTNEIAELQLQIESLKTQEQSWKAEEARLLKENKRLAFENWQLETHLKAADQTVEKWKCSHLFEKLKLQEKCRALEARLAERTS